MDGLPAMLYRLRERMAILTTEALHPGDTEGAKHRLLELKYVIDFFENFNEYADTETETVED